MAIFVDKFAKSFDNTNVSFSIWIKNKNEIDYDSIIVLFIPKNVKISNFIANVGLNSKVELINYRSDYNSDRGSYSLFT